jgi:hypothetical protein
MYNLVRWSTDLDLNEFYATANYKGFTNNSSQKMLVDSLAKEQEWCVWILYYNDQAVGSIGAHSFPEMGENSYRIAARTCVFTDKLPGAYGNGLRTISVITEHQNPTAQFLIPACIEWAPAGADLYITSNKSAVGTQRLVHRIFGPAMEKLGLMKCITEMEYRGTSQTVWQLFPDKFLKDLENFPKWN